MLGQDTCGCLYLTAGDVVFCVSPCDTDRDDDSFSWNEGWRGNSQAAVGEARTLEPVTGEQARRIFSECGALISDGYRAREIANALKYIGPRE